MKEELRQRLVERMMSLSVRRRKLAGRCLSFEPVRDSPPRERMPEAPRMRVLVDWMHSDTIPIGRSLGTRLIRRDDEISSLCTSLSVVLYDGPSQRHQQLEQRGPGGLSCR